jgi:hypothetical protein
MFPRLASSLEQAMPPHAATTVARTMEAEAESPARTGRHAGTVTAMVAHMKNRALTDRTRSRRQRWQLGAKRTRRTRVVLARAPAPPKAVLLRDIVKTRGEYCESRTRSPGFQ